MKQFILIGFCLIAKTIFSQGAVVSAPMTDQLLMEQATVSKTNFAEEIAELQKQSELIIETNERLIKVHSAIIQGKKTVALTRKTDDLFRLIGTSAKELKEANYPATIKEHPLDILSQLLWDVESIGNDLANVLKNGVFRMTDAERLNYINQLYVRVAEVDTNVHNTMRSARKYGSLYTMYTKN